MYFSKKKTHEFFSKKNTHERTRQRKQSMFTVVSLGPTYAFTFIPGDEEPSSYDGDAPHPLAASPAENSSLYQLPSTVVYTSCSNAVSTPDTSSTA